MDFGIGLSQTLKQEQTLSPQMLQSLALLPMPILELKAHIQQELENNPAFELPDSEFELSLSDPGDSRDRQLDDRMDDADGSDYESMAYESSNAADSLSYSDSYDGGFEGGYDGGYDPEASDRKQLMLENSSAPGETLEEHLLTQLGEVPVSETVNEIATMLIGNLDRNGFYIVPLQTLFEQKSFSEADIGKALSVVQSFDPAGICVQDYKESLILQARLSSMAESDLAIFSNMVNNQLEKLKAGKFKEVATSLRIPEEDLQTFFGILKGLTPYPGQSFSSEGIAGVEPEFSIHQKDGKLVLDMNRSLLPELAISTDFENLAKEATGPQAKEANSYIRESIRAARTLMTQVDLRFRTLYNAALAIMEMQSEFFLKGPRYLKTMTLKDIAEKIGVHETTMSRLAQSKWVDTDWGLFQMKYFFSQGVATTSDDQQSISRNAVKDMIAQIISENGALSDQKISDLLLTKGIKCARRTVSKYRAELNIDSSYTR